MFSGIHIHEELFYLKTHVRIGNHLRPATVNFINDILETAIHLSSIVSSRQVYPSYAFRVALWRYGSKTNTENDVSRNFIGD